MRADTMFSNVAPLVMNQGTIDNMRYMPNADVVGSVESISVERQEDSIDKYTSQNQNTRAGGKISVQTSFHNVPIIPEQLQQFTDDVSYWYLYSTLKMNVLQLFKKYNTSITDANGIVVYDIASAYNSEVFVRVQESCQIDLGDSVTSDDVLTAGVGIDDIDWSDAMTARFRVSTESGVFRTVAETLRALFGARTQTRIEGECYIDTLYTSSGGYMYNPFLAPNFEIEYDTSGFEPHSGMFGNPTKFYMTKVTIDSNEKVSFSMLSRNV
jgi:hypothetical protein